MFLCQKCATCSPVAHNSDGVVAEFQQEHCQNKMHCGFKCDNAACQALMLHPYLKVVSSDGGEPGVFCNEACYRQAIAEQDPQTPGQGMSAHIVVPCKESAYTNPALVMSPSGKEVGLVWVWEGSARPVGMVPPEIMKLLATLFLALPRVQELNIYRTTAAMRFTDPIIGDSTLPVECVAPAESFWERGGVLEADRKRKRGVMGNVEEVENCMFHNHTLIAFIQATIASPRVYEYDNWESVFSGKVEDVDKLFFKGDRKDDDMMCRGFKSKFMPGAVFKVPTVMAIVSGHTPSKMQPNLAKQRGDPDSLALQTFIHWLQHNYMEFLMDSVGH